MNSSIPYLSIQWQNESIKIIGTHHYKQRKSFSHVSEDSELSQGMSRWDWDGSKLTCQTSKTGYLPIYYCIDKNGITVSTSLIFLAKKQNSLPDLPAIILFLAIGDYIEEITPFANIHALPLDSILTWSPIEGLSVHLNRNYTHTLISYQEAMHQYNQLVCKSVQTYCAKDTSQGLSGGTDSRHILLAIHRLGEQIPSLYTSFHYIDGLSSADVEIAQMLAKSLGARIKTIYPISNRVYAEFIKNKIVEFQSLEHSWGINLANALKDSEFLYDGMNGGVLFGRSNLVKYLRKKHGQSLPDWDRMQKDIIETFFTRRIDFLRQIISFGFLSEENVNTAKTIFENSLQTYKNYPNPFQAFQYYNHVSRNTSLFTYRMMKNNAILCPLDTPEMVQFALSLPWEISSAPDFQKNTIRKYYPDFAHIPFVEEYQPQKQGFLLDFNSEIKSLFRIVKNFRNILTDKGLAEIEVDRVKLPFIQMFSYLVQLQEIFF